MLLVSSKGSVFDPNGLDLDMSERLRYLLLAFVFSVIVWVVFISGGVSFIGRIFPGVDNGSVAGTRMSH